MVVAVGAVLVFRGVRSIFSDTGLLCVPDEQSVEHDHQFHESGIFRNVLGEALRISIAKAVLNENGNVMEAFERSGFTDYSNFFKAFTKAVGVSPKKYASLSVS